MATYPTVERRVHPRPPPHAPHHPHRHAARAFGLGLISGAADNDPVAIGTYASAGAFLGPAVLWTAPVMLPMMATVVYLASKLGRVAGQGLGALVRLHYPRSIWIFVVAAVVVGNVVEAGADLGGIAAALNLLLPVPIGAIVPPLALALLAGQVFGSYTWMRDLFRWLALALLAYVGAAALAHPQWAQLLRATVVPQLRWDRHFLAVLVAIVGTALSPYLFVWQVSQEVEEDVARGRRRLSDRQGANGAEMRRMLWDVLAGMVFDVVVMYCIMVATAAALYPAAWGSLHSAAAAAAALRPLAGAAAGALFAMGVVGVGLLAVPVMTVGAAYVVGDALGWKTSLGARPREAPRFYAVIAAATAAAIGFNYLGFNPIHALVGAGIVQGCLAPVLIFLILQMTNRRAIMGPWTNSRPANLLAALTLALSSSAVLALLATL